jgi:hypothetical protein
MTRDFIMLHHSLTADGQTVSWPAIRRFHTETNGWRDIGYHYGIEIVSDGTGAPSIEVLVGRPETEHAAACPEDGMNSRAIHVCVVGNFDITTPSPALLKILVERCLKPVMNRYGITPDRIIGHRDRNPHKTCPGKLFDIERVRRLAT